MYSPNQNSLLASLPLKDLAIFDEHLKLVNLPLGQTLFTPSNESRFAYFPVNCLVSLYHLLESGKSSETACVGNDGLVGISLFTGSSSMQSSAVVVIPGYAFQLDSVNFKKAYANSPAFHRMLMLYIQVLMTQASFTAVCNRHHTVQHHFCRWILQSLDRVPLSEITITQELIANIIGVRREGISEVASVLQRKGIILYRRGHIKVVNRAGIENLVCECYNAQKKELKRLQITFQ